MAGRLTEATKALLAITPASAQHTECACFSAACQPCSAKIDNTVARWTFFFLRCNKGRNEHFFQNPSRINSNLNLRAFYLEPPNGNKYSQQQVCLHQHRLPSELQQQQKNLKEQNISLTKENAYMILLLLFPSTRSGFLKYCYLVYPKQQ